jgi:hypothetical protein
VHTYFYLLIEFVPAALIRTKLKDIAAMLGYARSEIFPKQIISIKTEEMLVVF